MDKILIITSHATDSHDINFAYEFANHPGRALTVAQLNRSVRHALINHDIVDDKNCSLLEATGPENHVSARLPGQLSFPLHTIDASGLSERELATHIRSEGYSLVIGSAGSYPLELQTLLSQIHCPLMVLPDHPLKPSISRAVYLTDLRYCQQAAVSYLGRFNQSSLLIAHICEPGLPNLDNGYDEQLFSDSFGHFSTRQPLFFSHIKETDTKKIIETLTETLEADMLVCVHRSSHFRRLFGERLMMNALPKHLSVPILVFPC